MSVSQFEIVALKSGVHSLRRKDNYETFHPGIGPAAEAKILHVDQNDIQTRASRPGSLIIWDVGLGAAANACAAIEALPNSVAEVEIHSFDLTTDPLRFALQNSGVLNYLKPHEAALKHLLMQNEVSIHPRLKWILHVGDFRNEMLKEKLPNPDVIFYDPYSPSSNLEMWTLDHFKNLKARLGDQHACLLTNYTRSTIVRVTWLLAGFYVGIGCTIGEKEETTVVSNCLSALKRPLTRSWLERVKISHSSAPIRGSEYTIAPISVEDLELLLSHPQLRL